MDGFAGFPLRTSLPRGSAFVNFTRGSKSAPAPEKAATPKPAPAPRQESLAVLRGGERVTQDEGQATPAAASEPNGEGQGSNQLRTRRWSPDVMARFVAVHGMTPSQFMAATGDAVSENGMVRSVK